MPRTAVSADLIHDRNVAAEDRALLDEIIAAARPACTVAVEQALRARTADTAAQSVVEGASRALADILNSDRHLGQAERELIAELSTKLRDGASMEPSVEHVHDYAQRLGSTMMRTWVSMLDQALHAGHNITLSDTLLAPTSSHRELIKTLMTVLQPFWITTDHAATIMRTLRDELMRDHDEVALPNDIQLEVLQRMNDGTPKKVVARRRVERAKADHR